MFKRALVSTSNKEGLVEFLKPIQELGCEIVSTGGTSKFLKENGLKVTEVSEATGFPEMMDGRVRTLHPKIHMGLLARSFVPDDFRLLKEHGVEPFDLVIVNLYPFAEAVSKGLKGRDLIEEIDIGGPSLLRAAAKSFERITVLCEPSDYSEVLLRTKEKSIDQGLRQKLAAKVFAHCSTYDGLIASVLGGTSQAGNVASLSQKISIQLDSPKALRYGENPHQHANFYKCANTDDLSLHNAEQKQGKELSYNNLLDLEAAVSVVSDFNQVTCAIIKHNTPCSVAHGMYGLEAYVKAFSGDPVSAFGGIVAINVPVDEKLATEMSQPFLECILAPEFSEGALTVLSQKKNLRVLVLKALKLPVKQKISRFNLDFKNMRGGALVQTMDPMFDWSGDWKPVGKNPPERIKKDMLFAQRVVKHVKSNAIVIVSNEQTIGICGGQTNRVDSVKMALERAHTFGANLKDWVLASDAFFPFRDSIDLAFEKGVRWVIQPGGSLKDGEVEQAVKEHEMGMVITGMRHFKH